MNYEPKSISPKELESEIEQRIASYRRRVYLEQRKENPPRQNAPSAARVYRALKRKMPWADSRPGMGEVFELACRLARTNRLFASSHRRSAEGKVVMMAVVGYLRDLGYSYPQIADAIGSPAHSAAIGMHKRLMREVSPCVTP